jgi:tetratricopeptide (TPR) repeat protein
LTIILLFDEGHLVQFAETGDALENLLQPDFPEALNNLGNAHAAAGRPADAERSYRAALRLRPDYAGARRNLDALLAGRGAGGQPAAPASGAR